LAGIRDALRALLTPLPAYDGSYPIDTVVREGRALDDAMWGTAPDTGNTIAGVRVSDATAMNASAVWACVRLISAAIAGMPLHAYRATATGRDPIDLPAWMTRPTMNPNTTRAVHIQQLVASLLLDGNAFIQFFPSVMNPRSALVLAPQDVEIVDHGFGSVEYRVRSAGRDLTPAEVVHILYVVVPGKERGLNPVDAARETIGLSLAVDQYGAAFFGNGATLSGVIEYPEGVAPTKDQVKEMVQSFRRRHVGTTKSHAVGALTGGAKWKENSASHRDSQFLELREYQIEDIGRLYGVPPHILGSQKPGSVSYASVELRNIDFVTHGLQPVIEKIEDGYDRVMPSGTFLKFNVAGLLRSDAKSRWESYGIALDKKVILREEVRALEDLPNIGALGFLETPNNNPPDDPPEEPADE
jgi:HK97 family phage portal protein